MVHWFKSYQAEGGGVTTRALRKIPSVEFFESQSKNAIFASLHFSNSYLFENCAAYPYTAGHFELIEVPYHRYLPYSCGFAQCLGFSHSGVAL